MTIYILVTFLIFILPFVVIPGMYNPYEYPKFISILVCTQLYILYRVFLYIREKKPLIVFDMLSLSVAVFLLLLFLANSIGLDPYISFWGSSYRSQGFLLYLALGILFFLLYALSPQEKLRLFTKASIISLFTSLLLSSISIVHALLFYGFQNVSIPTWDNRIVATFGNPNFLGGYIVVLFPLALQGIIQLKKLSKKKQLLLRILLLLCTFLTILVSGSKSALIAFFLLLLFFAWQRYHTVLFTNKKFLLVFGALVILLIFLFSAQFRFSYWDNRLLIWSYGMTSVMKHPFFGIGQENYELIVNPAHHIVIDNAHNIFLEIAVAAGVPGLLCFLYILYQAIKKASYPITLALIAFLITAEFNPLSIAQVALFWVLLGLISREGKKSKR